MIIIERARSPPLVRQNEEDLSDEEDSIENDDEIMLDQYTATGNFRPGM